MPEFVSRHLGWCFSGMPSFEGRAASFLARGLQRNEQLFFVADDPNPELWPDDIVLRGILRIASTREIYGPETTVRPFSQRRLFDDVLAEALREGYQGIRVAADNTSMVSDQSRLEAWLRWEQEVDGFVAENPVTGLCAFDRLRVNPEALRMVLHLHGHSEADEAGHVQIPGCPPTDGAPPLQEHAGERSGPTA